MRQTRWVVWLGLIFLLAMTPLSWAADDEEEGAEKASHEIEYLPLKPKLVVNLAGRRHYLSAGVQLMIKGDDNLERIQKNMPLIRHTLIMHFSNLPLQQVTDIGEREKLRESALHAIRKTLDKYSDSDGLKDIFFTDFLVQ